MIRMAIENHVIAQAEPLDDALRQIRSAGAERRGHHQERD